MENLVEYFFIVGLDPESGLQPLPNQHIMHPFKRLYECKLLSRYPEQDRPKHPFPNYVENFCFPEGYCLKKPQPKQNMIIPTYHGFVLTEMEGSRLYGVCVLIYEKMTPEMLAKLTEDNPKWAKPGEKEKAMGDLLEVKKSELSQNIKMMEKRLRVANNPGEIQRLENQVKQLKADYKQYDTMLKNYLSEFHMDEPHYYPKAIGLLSTQPYFDFFKDYLSLLWQTITHGPPLPLERYIVNIVNEVPLPPPGQKEVKVTIEKEKLYCRRPEWNDIPILKNFEFYLIFQYFTPESFVTIMECILNERPIIFYSKSPCVLNYVIATFTTLLFPFYWPFTYVPVLPRTMVSILDEAIVPFIVGVMDVYKKNCPDLSSETVQIDLESSSIICDPEPVRLPDSIRNELIEKIEEMKKKVSYKVTNFSNVYSSSGRISPITSASILESKQYANKLSGSASSSSTPPGKLEKRHSTTDHLRARSNTYKTTIWEKFRRTKSMSGREKDDFSATYFDDYKMQKIFMHAFLPLIKHYSSCLNPLTEEQIQNFDISAAFNFEEFLAKSPNEYKDFMKVFVKSQIFTNFCVERAIRTKDDPEVLLVDGLIKNSKSDPFVNDTETYKISQVVEAVPPNAEGLTETSFRYKTFPDFLKKEYLIPPRPVESLYDPSLQLKLQGRTKAFARIQRLKQNKGFFGIKKDNGMNQRIDQELQNIYNNLLFGEISDAAMKCIPVSVLEDHIQTLNASQEKLIMLLDGISVDDKQSLEQVKSHLQQCAVQITRFVQYLEEETSLTDFALTTDNASNKTSDSASRTSLATPPLSPREA